MSWTDKELDDLFKEASGSETFEYNRAYFKDIEAQLPLRKKRKGIFWWIGGTGTLLFVGFIFTLVGLPGKTNVKHVQTNITKQIGNKRFDKIETRQELENNELSTDAATVKSVLNEKSSSKWVVLQKDVAKDFLLTEKENQSSLITASNLNQAINTETELEDTYNYSLQTLNLNSLNTMTSELLQSNWPSFIKTKQGSSFFAEITSGIGQSPIQSTENGSSQSFSWAISAGYEYRRKSWSFAAGMGMTESYFNNVYIKERTTVYGFGANTLDNEYRFSSLFSLSLPVSASFRIGQHELVGGMNTIIPISAGLKYTEFIDGNIAQQNEGFTNPNFFRKVLFEPTIGYRFSLGNDWQIGARVGVLLMNPLNSDRILGERTATPLSGQITLRKTFEY